MKKYSNGILVDMTTEEINQHNLDVAEAQANAFPNALEFLRVKRDALLAETDYLALSDQTMSAEMTTYRQALRDITNGLTTVEQVNAVVWPERPEV